MSDSLLRQLMNSLGGAASSAASMAGDAFDSASAATRGGLEDLFGTEEDYGGPLNPGDPRLLKHMAGFPMRVGSRALANFGEAGGNALEGIDNMSEQVFGSPLIMSRPVEPGVSKDEMDSAATKLMTAHAKAKTQEVLRKQAEESMLQEQLALLKEKSGQASEFYAARGDEIRRGDGSKVRKNTPRGGSLSKVKMQDENTREVDKLESQGMPRPLAEAINQLSRAQNNAQMDAAKMRAGAINSKPSPEKRRAEILQGGLNSKNPQAMLLVRALLSSEGYSEEMINKLFGKTQ